MALQSFDDGASDSARQFLLDNRCERKHSKRHRTRKRQKSIATKKRSRIAHVDAMRSASERRYYIAVRLYWQGLADYPRDFR